MLERRDFGPDAIAFVRASLSRGGMSLSKSLLNLPLEKGRVSAYLPEPVGAEAAKRFDIGGMFTPEDEREAEEKIAGIITSHLRQSDCACAVFENPVMRPTDPSARRSELRLLTLGDEVYFFLPPGETELSNVIATLRGVHSWVFNGVLTAAEGLDGTRNRQEVNGEILEVLAANSEHILVSAYDYEGYLIWSRK